MLRRPPLPSLALRPPHLALAAALATSGCGVSEELYNARVNELGRIKADLDAHRKAELALRDKCDKQVADLDAQNAALKQRLAKLGEDVVELESTNTTLAADLERIRKQQEAAEARLAQFRALVGKFKQMIDAGRLQVVVRDGLMLVKLADNILFDPGRADLKADGKQALREVSQVLQGIEGRKFQVAGHTDDKPLVRHGSFKNNWELSAARAVEVVQFMIKEGGMPPDRLSAAGFADQLPVAPNDGDEGRRQNRRIEIVLLPNIEDLPPLDDLAHEPPAPQAEPAPALPTAPPPPP